MEIFEKDSIKNLVLEILSKGPKKGTDLIEDIKSVRKGTTKQGAYKALRVLIKEKIVVKYKKSLMLNQLWINKLNKFTRQTDRNYLARQDEKIDTLDWMKEGSEISYVFNGYNALDKFHSHIFSLIIKKTDPQAPLYAYNPHEWFVLKTTLKENEDYLLEWLKERKRQIYFTIGNETILDKKFRDNYSSEDIEIMLDKNMNYPINYYINVIGDYVIETKNEKVFAEKLQAIYEDCIDDGDASEKIKTLLKSKHKIKMILSCDSKKAKKIKAKLRRNFFVPKELRGK